MQPGGEFNIQELVRRTTSLQEQLFAARAGLADTEVVGAAGGGLVRVTMTAAGEVRSIRIDPEAVDTDDIQKLEDLLIAAMHDATVNIRTLAEGFMKPFNEAVARLNRLER